MKLRGYWGTFGLFFVMTAPAFVIWLTLFENESLVYSIIFSLMGSAVMATFLRADSATIQSDGVSDFEAHLIVFMKRLWYPIQSRVGDTLTFRPSVFGFHYAMPVTITRHGDEFEVLGPRIHVKWLQRKARKLTARHRKID